MASHELAVGSGSSASLEGTAAGEAEEEHPDLNDRLERRPLGPWAKLFFWPAAGCCSAVGGGLMFRLAIAFCHCLYISGSGCSLVGTAVCLKPVGTCK